MSHELEEEALQREAEIEKQVKALQAAFAERERKQAEELQAKDQQLAELQVSDAFALHQSFHSNDIFSTKSASLCVRVLSQQLPADCMHIPLT